MRGRQEPLDGEAKFRAAVQARCPKAWGQLFQLYSKPLLRKARFFLPARLDPENAVAEVWLKGIESARHYDPSQPPYPWLARICANVCLNIRRRPRLRLFGLRPDRDPPASEGEIACARAAAHAALRHAVRQLSRRQGEVVVLRYLFGVRTKEIASLLGRRAAAVRKDLPRIADRLRSGRMDESLKSWMAELGDEGL